jgi:putative hemolysin
MKRILAYTFLWMALTACTASQSLGVPDTAATDLPQTGLPNPASVYCTQKGNKLEIRTAVDGSQTGDCIFPDGSACDEWAYYRGECGLASQNRPTPAMAIDATTKASDGSGRITADTDMPPGPEEKITDWWGVIKSTASGAQYDDYFERQGLGQVINFGIDSMDPVIQAQIKTLRDSGKIVHLYGAILSNVPDYNGSQIRVDRIEVEG